MEERFVPPVPFLCSYLNPKLISGAPVDLAPLKDDPALGANTQERNNFRYTADNNDQQAQDRCPFAAHTRKTNPRADLEDHGIPTDPQRIIRRGIQFGPEVSAEEAASSKTAQERGLLFACYQSNIANGFQFIQSSKFIRPSISHSFCPCFPSTHDTDT